jgi:hypothetical protein
MGILALVHYNSFPFKSHVVLFVIAAGYFLLCVAFEKFLKPSIAELSKLRRHSQDR